MAGLFGNIKLFPHISLLILMGLSFGLWCWLRYKSSYWTRRGVPSISLLTCLRNSLQYLLGRQQLLLTFDELYKSLAGHKYGGTFQLTEPSILLRDPEVIRNVLVRGFSNFHDRGPPPDESYDPLSENLFQLTGETWHQARRKISPAFSNANMRTMYQSLQSYAQKLNTYLQDSAKTGNTEIDVKEQMCNYTLDVIGACALGVDCDVIRNPKSEFKRVLSMAFEFGIEKALVVFLYMVHPKLPKYFRLKSRPIELDEFLQKVCRDAIEMKSEDSESERRDFLQILMSLRSEEAEKELSKTEEETLKIGSPEESGGPIFTENVLLSVITIFIFAGYEPVAAVLAFCLYELALHPEIQDKILREILSVKKEPDGVISYEDLKKMLYTDQVINETLRKYPVAGVLTRTCTESFKMPDSSLVVEKDVKVIVPVYSLHHDPQYFPEPEKFDPNRFAEANIERIAPGTYLPFGDGPRVCIAMRFALLDVKTMVTTLISNYSLYACAKTPQPIVFDARNFSLSAKDGLWIGLQKRK